MSAEMDLIRSGYEAFNRGDLDAVVTLAAPDCEVHPSGAFPDVSTAYHGPEGFRQFCKDIRGGWDEVRVVVHDLQEAGDRVLALLRLEARGREGIELSGDLAHLFTMRGGLGVRLEGYASWEEGRRAMEAAGRG